MDYDNNLHFYIRQVNRTGQSNSTYTPLGQTTIDPHPTYDLTSSLIELTASHHVIDTKWHLIGETVDHIVKHYDFSVQKKTILYTKTRWWVKKRRRHIWMSLLLHNGVTSVWLWARMWLLIAFLPCNLAKEIKSAKKR